MSNVVQMKTTEEELNNLQNRMNKYFEKRFERSANTKRNYLTWIKEFFQLTTNKDINNLCWQDLINITIHHVEIYVDSLKK